MNPIFEAMKHRGSIPQAPQANDDNRTKVLSMIRSMSPQQKAKLKAYTPMLQSLAKKFGVNDFSFQQCMREINL